MEDNNKILRTKEVLGRLSVLFMFILIITNATLFRLYTNSEREKNIIQDNNYCNISKSNTNLNIIKNFIIEECNGSGVFYFNKTDYREEMLICMIKDCDSEGYCRDIRTEFIFDLDVSYSVKS